MKFDEEGMRECLEYGFFCTNMDLLVANGNDVLAENFHGVQLVSLFVFDEHDFAERAPAEDFEDLEVRKIKFVLNFWKHDLLLIFGVNLVLEDIQLLNGAFWMMQRGIPNIQVLRMIELSLLILVDLLVVNKGLIEGGIVIVIFDFLDLVWGFK